MQLSVLFNKGGNKIWGKFFVELGQRGLKYICRKQNVDGSWFYAGSPERPTIDCFHQSYILQAICSVKEYLHFDVNETIKKV